MRLKHKTCRRYNDTAHAHSLTFSCYHRRKHFADDAVRDLLIKSIQNARERHLFDLWAYVVMPDHVHLLIFPREEEYSISSILAGIKRPVAYWANHRMPSSASTPVASCGRPIPPNAQSSDPFWQQGGGYDRNLFNPAAVHAEIQYIHENPVRKGLCELPEQWRYSSAAFWNGGIDAPLMMDRTVPPLDL